MSKSKLAALVLLSGSYMLALGMNCIPNVPNLFGNLGLGNLFGQ
jgi:hypothetical protein